MASDDLSNAAVDRDDRVGIPPGVARRLSSRRRVGGEAPYRILYASLAASLGQQIGALATLAQPSPWSRSPSPSISRPRAPRSSDTSVRRDHENPDRSNDRRRRPPRRHRREHRTHAVGAADDLRGRVAHRRLPLARLRAAVQLRRLRDARDADPKRRACRSLRVCSPAQHAAAVQTGPRRQARDLHLESARAHRPELEPRRHPHALRPQAQARQARRRRPGRPRRGVHADGAEEDGPELGALEGGQPGARRAGRHEQGGARPGRRRLRLHHGCASGQ